TLLGSRLRLRLVRSYGRHHCRSSVLLCRTRPARRSTLFPYTTLFRSCPGLSVAVPHFHARASRDTATGHTPGRPRPCSWAGWSRSEEHTSELQSRFDLVCRLLLEKKKLYRSVAGDEPSTVSTVSTEHR